MSTTNFWSSVCSFFTPWKPWNCMPISLAPRRGPAVVAAAFSSTAAGRPPWPLVVVSRIHGRRDGRRTEPPRSDLAPARTHGRSLLRHRLVGGEAGRSAVGGGGGRIW
ncbi:unnamed protein product [Urochloa humidicola]